MTDVLGELPKLTQAGERIVAAAGELFLARGVRAVGVDLIADSAGTTKKTLYDRFGSKDALITLWLVRRARAWQSFLEGQLAEQQPGVGRVLAVFDAVEVWMSGLVRGCAFVNTYAEVGGTDHPAVPVIRAEKAWMRARFETLLVEGGFDSVPQLASGVHLLYEGALITATVGDEPTAFGDARHATLQLLRSHVAGRS